MHACRLQCGPARLAGGAGPKLALGDGPSFRSVALQARGHLKEGAQKLNEGAQESKGGAAPRYVALANSLMLDCNFCIFACPHALV